MALAVEEGEAKKHVIRNSNRLFDLHDANSLRFKHELRGTCSNNLPGATIMKLLR